MYVYIETNPGLFTVGFFGRGGIWQPESDWPSAHEAGQRVHYLNGGSNAPAKIEKRQESDEIAERGRKAREAQKRAGDKKAGETPAEDE